MLVNDSTLTQNGFGPGEIVRLSCKVAAGTTLSESARLAFENEIASSFKASGWDQRPSALTNPASLKAYLKPQIAIFQAN